MLGHEPTEVSPFFLMKRGEDRKRTVLVVLTTLAVGFFMGRISAPAAQPAQPTMSAVALEVEEGGCPNAAWTQCGGAAFEGQNCCPDGATCIIRDASFSQCVPACTNIPWGQCGGDGFKGDTCCPVGAPECIVRDASFSQCVPAKPVAPHE